MPIFKTSIKKTVDSYHFTEDEYKVLTDNKGNEYIHFETQVGTMHVVGNVRPLIEEDFKEKDFNILEFSDLHTVDGTNRYRIKVTVHTVH